jgi:hypothetical protein
VADVASLTVVDADGEEQTASRTETPELFGQAGGG